VPRLGFSFVDVRDVADLEIKAMTAPEAGGQRFIAVTKFLWMADTGEILREGQRVALLGYGTGVAKALEAADLLAERGLEVTVADARFAKPIDAGLVAQLAAEHELLVTVEEGVLAGGFGSAVWETLSDAGLVARILRVGLPDQYVTHGAPKLLHEEVGFTGQRIAERIEAAVDEQPDDSRAARQSEAGSRASG